MVESCISCWHCHVHVYNAVIARVNHLCGCRTVLFANVCSHGQCLPRALKQWIYATYCIAPPMHVINRYHTMVALKVTSFLFLLFLPLPSVTMPAIRWIK
jgi:hypothetical protein